MALSGMQKTRLIIASAYVVVLAGLGLYDEPPDPQRVAEMTRSLPPVIDADNAWLAFLGFSAPSGESPITYGEELLRKSRAIQAQDSDAAAWLPATDGTGLSFQGELPCRSVDPGDSLLACAGRHSEEIAGLVRDNGELLRRYVQLGSFSRFNEPLDDGYAAPIPLYSPLRQLQKLTFLQLAILAAQGDVATALERLSANAEFWRFIARSSQTLISKLIAIAQLHETLRFAAELGACPLNDSEWAQLTEILRPFSLSEASLVDAIRGESRYMVEGLEFPQRRADGSWTLDRLFYKLEATKNRMYTDHQDYLRLAGLPARQFATETRRPEEGKRPSSRMGLSFLYNPVGEILRMIAQGSGFLNYIEKGHDLEGLRRLVGLKVRARKDQVSPEEMPGFLEAQKAEFGNPFTGEAMQWDAAEPKIYFKRLDGEKTIEVSW